jgi:hypothetical protein
MVEKGNTLRLSDNYIVKCNSPEYLDFVKGSVAASIAVNNSCQFSCPTCYNNGVLVGGREMALEMYQSIMRLPYIVQVGLPFGEPMLHSKIEQIVAKTVPEAFISLTTNGFEKERLKRLIANFTGVKGLRIYLSMDSDHAKNHQARGSNLIATAAELKKYAAANNVLFDFNWRNIGEDSFVQKAAEILNEKPEINGVRQTDDFGDTRESGLDRKVPSQVYVGVSGELWDNPHDFGRANTTAAIGKIVRA